MAESVVSYAVETIGKLLIDEAKFLLGVEGKVDELQRELKVIQGFLRDADAKREHDHAIGECVAQLRDIAYDAEDVIERYILKVAPKKEQNIIKAYACFVAKCKWVQVHRVGTKIGGFKSSISNLRTSMRDYGVQKMNEGESKRPRASMRRPTYAHFEEDFVGREDNVKELVELLEAGRQERVISIWGMGGLGKTSLVQKVIARDEVKNNFDVAWACVSQEYHVKDILVEILKLIPDQTKEVKKMTDGQLFDALYNIQKEKRCLVVLDNIWTKDAWNRLKPAFPFNETSSKLLITTRYKKVAEHIGPHGYIHELQCLTTQKSWELLMKRASPEMKSIVSGQVVEGSERRSELQGQLPAKITEDMKRLGDELLEKCGGLPLAIITLGGLLAKNEWKMVHEKINLYFGDQSDISKVLALSYDDLPWHLKPCFLYLGSFPEDAETPATKVLNMWIAEGFVSLSAYEEVKEIQVEDVAEQYLMELVNRGMVQVRFSWSGKIKTCHLHDLMRDLCISKATQEGFLSTLSLKHDGKTKGCSSLMATKVEQSCRIRRLSINTCKNVKGNTLLHIKPMGRMMLQLRIFMFFESYEGMWNQFQPIFNHCKFLRVLKLEGLDQMRGNLPDSVGDLIHLRFLSLAKSQLEGLPQSIGNLVRLEYLNLDIDSMKMMVPNVLWKMRKLRNLHLPLYFSSFEIRKKLQLDTLENQRKLEKFSQEYCDVKDIDGLTNLQNPTVVGDKQLEIIAQLAKFNLIHLQCSFSMLTMDSFTVGELSKVSSYRHSCKLSLFGNIKKLLEHTSLPQRLRKLVLNGSQLEEDPMSILEKLNHLVDLMLGTDTFVGTEMVCSTGGFPQLRHLLLDGLYHLEELMVAEGGMPRLARLGISECPKLKTSPPPGVPTYDCSDDAWKERMKALQQLSGGRNSGVGELGGGGGPPKMISRCGKYGELIIIAGAL